MELLGTMMLVQRDMMREVEVWAREAMIEPPQRADLS